MFMKIMTTTRQILCVGHVPAASSQSNAFTQPKDSCLRFESQIRLCVRCYSDECFGSTDRSLFFSDKDLNKHDGGNLRLCVKLHLVILRYNNDFLKVD